MQTHNHTTPHQRVSTMSTFLVVLLAPLLVSSVLAAPHSTDRLDSVESIDFPNPFIPGPEQLSLLQEYLQEENPKPSDLKRETVIFHLFVLNDFDKSGLLDGLELMRLLQELLVKVLKKEPGQDSVVSMVDEILLTQDTNKDGLLSAQELVTPPISKVEEAQAISVAIPVPPGPHTGDPALENDTEVENNTNQPSENADQLGEDKFNDNRKVLEPTPPSPERPIVADHDNASVEETNKAEEVEEADEDNVETEDSQEEAVAENEM